MILILPILFISTKIAAQVQNFSFSSSNGKLHFQADPYSNCLVSLHSDNLLSVSFSFCSENNGVNIINNVDDALLAVSETTMRNIYTETKCPEEQGPTNNNRQLFVDLSCGSLACEGTFGVNAVDVESSVLPRSIPIHSIYKVQDQQMKSFHYNLDAIEDGLDISVFPDSGTSRVYLSFCANMEGNMVGKAVYPKGLSIGMTSRDLVNLIDETSCMGALYHDLEYEVPVLIIRIQSMNASGVVSVSHHNEGNSIQRHANLIRSLVQDLRLEKNESEVFDLRMQGDFILLKFHVVSGNVVASLRGCPEAEFLETGFYDQGDHLLRLEGQDIENLLNKSLCSWNETFDESLELRIETDTGVLVSVTDVTLEETTTNSQLTWFEVGAILICVSAILLLLIAIFCFYFRRNSGEFSLEHENEQQHGIPMRSFS